MTESTRRWSVLRQSVVCAVGLIVLGVVLVATTTTKPWVVAVGCAFALVGFVAGRWTRRLRSG